LGPPLPRISREFGECDHIKMRRLRFYPPPDVPSERELQILARVRATPAGFVRTYGDVSPGAPRVAGAALHACDDPSVPWHRIVRADGSLAKGARQRTLLEREGVPFRGRRVDMRVARLPFPLV
jgi:methylated-DNA-protein-cysteine methyltransferase-like protein